MALAALIVSISSAIAALAAVVASVWTHQQQGSLLSCEFDTAHKIAADEVQRLTLPASEWGVQYASVRAVNRGRSATTIAGWGFAYLDHRGRPTEAQIVALKHDPDSPALPYRLEAESSATWMMRSEWLVAEIARYEGTFHGIAAFIRSGAGRIVYCSEPVPFQGDLALNPAARRDGTRPKKVRS